MLLSCLESVYSFSTGKTRKHHLLTCIKHYGQLESFFTESHLSTLFQALKVKLLDVSVWTFFSLYLVGYCTISVGIGWLLRTVQH